MLAAEGCVAPGLHDICSWSRGAARARRVSQKPAAPRRIHLTRRAPPPADQPAVLCDGHARHATATPDTQNIERMRAA